MVDIITTIVLGSNKCFQSYFYERKPNMWQKKAEYLKSVPTRVGCMVILPTRTLKLLILFSQTAIKYNLRTVALTD